MTDDASPLPLWDHAALHQALTEATERVLWLRTRLNDAHTELLAAADANDAPRTQNARVKFDADLAALQAALSIQQHETRRLEHLDAQAAVRRANDLSELSTATAQTMVTWTKVLAGATVVLAFATLTLIWATLTA